MRSRQRQIPLTRACASFAERFLFQRNFLWNKKGFRFYLNPNKNAIKEFYPGKWNFILLNFLFLHNTVLLPERFADIIHFHLRHPSLGFSRGPSDYSPILLWRIPESIIPSASFCPFRQSLSLNWPSLNFRLLSCNLPLAQYVILSASQRFLCANEIHYNNIIDECQLLFLFFL